MTANLSVCYFDAVTGEWRGSANAPQNDIIANTPAGCLIVPGYLMGNTHYCFHGEILPRPAPVSISATGTTPHLIDLSGFPAGTTVTLRNEDDEVMVLTEMTAPVVLKDAGLYRFSAAPPFPHHPVALEIEVADA